MTFKFTPQVCVCFFQPNFFLLFSFCNFFDFHFPVAESDRQLITMNSFDSLTLEAMTLYVCVCVWVAECVFDCSSVGNNDPRAASSSICLYAALLFT